MFEVILAIGITPVFLIIGVIPGLIFTGVSLVLYLGESSGIWSALKNAVGENRARKAALEIIEGEYPTTEAARIETSYKIHGYAGAMKTQPEYRHYFHREACLLHIDGWSLYCKDRIAEAHDNGEDAIKVVQEELDVAIADLADTEDEYVSGDRFVHHLNAILPSTTPLILPGTQDTDLGNKAVRDSEEAAARITDWPDDVLSDMYARVSLVWLNMYFGCLNKTSRKLYLRNSRLWSDMSLDAYPESPLGLLCRYRVGKTAGHPSTKYLHKFIDCTRPDRRDYPCVCYETAICMYRECDKDEMEVDEILSLVKRGKEAEEEYAKFWRDNAKLPQICDGKHMAAQIVQKLEKECL